MSVKSSKQAKEDAEAKARASNGEFFVPSTEWQDVPDWAAFPASSGATAHYRLDPFNNRAQARWDEPVPAPELVTDKRTGQPQTAHPEGEEQENRDREPYKPTGNTPIGYLKRGVVQEEIILGDGFLERGTACLLAGSSGIGKSSIAMQMGCCWACGKPAFYLNPLRSLRIVMVQNEDSDNDLSRQSEVIRHLGLDESLIEQNFWIETLRGKIGAEAVRAMRDLVKWRRADLLMLNPLSAYHSGDISSNRDNIGFLYGELGALLAEKKCAIFGFHHKGKPPKNISGNRKPEDVYFDIMYDILGGSALTNFFRGLITVSAIGNSEVFKFALAKRFPESGWDQKFQMFKWHEDKTKHLWVPASFAESDKAKAAGKTLEDLHKLIPVLGMIPREVLEHAASAAGFTRVEYRGLLARALDDSTPDDLRLYEWSIYNPLSTAKVGYSRSEQSSDETHAAVKEAKAKERQAVKNAAKEAAKAAKEAKKSAHVTV